MGKEIDGAPDENTKSELLRRTLLTPKVYGELFNTYHGDLATKAKIRSRALQLGVHPDAGDLCSEMFIASALTAGLGTADGDGIRLSSADVAPPARIEESGGENTVDATADGSLSDLDVSSQLDTQQEQLNGRGKEGTRVAKSRPGTAAAVTLNLTVDSGTDGDKLEKQLSLLRRFGLI